MGSRVITGAVIAILAVGLVGCSGATPRASPTPTPPFANADAAYRAAEATYRGYVEAGNQIDLANPKTFEPVYGWLLGDALKTDEEELTAMSARGWKFSGEYRVALMQPIHSADSDPLWGDVSLATCFDVSEVKLADSAGSSVVSPSRVDMRPLKVTLSRDGATPTGMKIIKIQDREGQPECGS